MMHPVIPYLVAAGLFGLGCYGVLVRRNAILMLMSVELMLNAVNLVLVTADATVRAALPRTGAVFALFVIVLAAAEVGVGLAIVLQLYRLRRTVVLDNIALDSVALEAASPDSVALDSLALDSGARGSGAVHSGAPRDASGPGTTGEVAP
jgi:NADH-quinone oxidoreductase subunit K